mmetsp:Transcript_23286/g.36566  ORF Transcript_23286/g.36566 Transcript_23286/m.36566 type:complete len:197 (-) Transcript_23286:163-753(-)|eukprot:CAMPEP_0201604752 /NCGR_PEP_ID=MMETSP0492-20130828/4799_1 /ASSEMBLY_ACC=CAM_ASM_000837 /TAXON_ID=420259 /ORGANISM="Thalassiosira gravida, Strain GMp14c1" /LENGTH=196 /DNA_ID=CAMNT_0048068857 /DNA_START=63 /DNA_END=653 /DNA_ORIENTATION=-
MTAAPSFSWCIAAALLASATQTEAFSGSCIVSFPHMKCRNAASTTVLNMKRPVGGRHFQLEELEDAETSTTDVLLNTDLTVTLGGTNGPLYIDSSGTWSESCVFLKESEEDFKRLFEMKLTKKFATGAEGSNDSDIGEFEYSVERTYKGECFLVGGRVFAMNGEILDVDEIFGERRLGFFNMIDTTEERLNNAMEV